MGTRVAIAGIGGRMGSEVRAASAAFPELELVAGVVRPGSGDGVGRAAEVANGVRIVEAVDDLDGQVDVLIDFTEAGAAVGLAAWCAGAGVALVSGTTGLSAEQMDRVWAAAERVPVFYARNMSLGIGALLQALPLLVAALPGYDAEIVETHHRGKRDAPSGTALALAEAIASGLDGGTPDLTFGREGIAPRRAGEVGIHAVRAGGNPGEHAVILAGDGEEVRLCHRSFGRRAYAEGALRAARFVAGRPAGRYGPLDVLGAAG